MLQVSVVIPTYNHARFIREAIDSVLAQTYPVLEIIVVDDGSTDDTKDILFPYLNKIRYIYQSNMRMSAARNAGIRAARGNIIAFLDSDDIWCREKLEEQIQLFEKYPAAGLISCDAEQIDEHGNTVGKIELSFDRLRKADMNKIVLSNIVPGGGSSALVKMECFDVVGNFDQSLCATAEDWEMWIRIAMKYEIYFVQKPLTRIRSRADSVSAPANAEQMLSDELRMLNKVFASHDGFNIYGRRTAYAHRYSRAAWALMETGKRYKACTCIAQAFLSNPPHFLTQPDYIALLCRIMFGNNMYKAIAYSFRKLSSSLKAHFFKESI